MSLAQISTGIGISLGIILATLKGSSVTRKEGIKNSEERNQSVCFKEYEDVLVTQGNVQKIALENLRKCQAKNAVNWY